MNHPAEFHRARPAPGRPKAAAIPSGDRLRYSATEGHQ
jgi:hypothetical protein